MNTLLLTPGSPIQVGQKLVEIQQQIGAGSFGVVHKVKDMATQGEYALKEVVCENESEILDVKNEILTLRNIYHPNVISIFESGDYDDTKGLRHMLILTEYCPGGNLNDRLTRESREEVEWKWIRQMAEALRFIHASNLVHRDLKPENVLLTATDDIKIGDFGSARKFISLKETRIVQCTVTTRYVTYTRYYMNTYAGTRHWMAPEVFHGPQGHGHYSEKADVFSLGVLFLAILERDFIIDHKGKRYYGTFVNVPGEGKVSVGYAMCKCGSAVAVSLQARRSNTGTLQMIALDALDFEQKDRPTAIEILNRINSFISSVLCSQFSAQPPVLGPQFSAQRPVLGPQFSAQPPVLRSQVLPQPPVLSSQVLAQQPVLGPQFSAQPPVLGPQFSAQPPVLRSQVLPQPPVLSSQVLAHQPVLGPQFSAKPLILGPLVPSQPPVLGPQVSAQPLILGPQVPALPPVLGPQVSAQPRILGTQVSAQPPVLGPQVSVQPLILSPQVPAQPPGIISPSPYPIPGGIINPSSLPIPRIM